MSLKKYTYKEPAEVRYKHITPQNIIDKICLHYDVTFEELAGKGQKKELVEPRQITCYLIKKYVIKYITYDDGYDEEKFISFSDIGKILNKDHSTIIYSRKAVKNHAETEKEYKKNLKKLEGKIVEFISKINP